MSNYIENKIIKNRKFSAQGSIQGYAQPKECPELSELEQTSIKDKKEVIEAFL